MDQKLIKVDELWNWITRKETFSVFYASVKGHQINVYMRYVPDIVETKSSFGKAKLVSTHLGNLVSNIIQFIPVLQSVLRGALEKIELLPERLNEVENE
ncbi:hypothetical protein D3C81_2030220 [compost metagenome]